MNKFDPTCGLTKNEIRIIKYNVKNEISKQLPYLPESIETKLFLQGRYAWGYRWYLLNEKYPISLEEKIYLKFVAKLKKEFHHQNKTHYKFMCKVQLKKEDIYHPELKISNIAT